MPTFTLADLKAGVYGNLDNNTLFYPAAQVTRAINQVLKCLNLFTGYFQDTLYLNSNDPATVNAPYLYTMPSGIIFPTQVSYEERELRPLELATLSRQYRNFLRDNTAKVGPVQHWTRIGMRTFILHPWDSVGGRLIGITGVVPVPALVSDSDTISIPDEWEELVLDFATGRVIFKLGGKPFSDAAGFYKSWQAKTAQMSIWQEYQQPELWIEKQAK